MRYLFGIICVCSLGVLPILGCSETTGDGGAGGDAGTGGSAGMGGGAGTGGMGGLEYNINLSGLEPDGSTIFIQDVEVCVADTENCVMSNVLGTATLNVPADQEIVFTFEKEGYGKWLMPTVSDGNHDTEAQRRMYTDAQLEATAADLQTTYPWQGGIVGLVRFPSKAGVTFTPVGSSVGAVGDSFYYDSSTEEYSLDLNASTEFADDWRLPLGAGGFIEVTPGEQQFELGGTAGDCVSSWAWPGDTANSIRVPVREGYRTYGSMSGCTPP